MVFNSDKNTRFAKINLGFFWFILLYLFALCLPFLTVRLNAAKYAGEPFYLGVGAQALAMGGAFGASAADVTAGFWNPAGLSLLGEKQIAFMHSETFGSLLNHDYLAFAAPLDPDGGRAAAISLTRLGGGGVKITEWDLDQNRPRIIREENHADYQLILSYALKKGDKLALGANAKFIYRDIPTSSAYGLGADIGIRYHLANQLAGSLVIRDFTTTLLYYEIGTRESIYPMVVPGIRFHTKWNDFGFILACDADLRFENLKDAAEFWMGSLSLDTHWGTEISYQDIVYARGGMDIGKLTLGGGLKIFPLQIDFAYLNHKDLDDSFRLSALFFWQ